MFTKPPGPASVRTVAIFTNRAPKSSNSFPQRCVHLERAQPSAHGSDRMGECGGAFIRIGMAGQHEGEAESANMLYFWLCTRRNPMKSAKSSQIVSLQNALKLTRYMHSGAKSAPSCSRSHPVRRRRAPRRSSYGRCQGLALLARHPPQSTAHGGDRVTSPADGRVCGHVHATWRGKGTRGRGEMCEFVVFPAMCPPELHEIAKKAPETFSSDHVETRGGHATWGGECTVVFARPCDAASARPTAIFIRAAPRSSSSSRDVLTTPQRAEAVALRPRRTGEYAVVSTRLGAEGGREGEAECALLWDLGHVHADIQ